MNDTSQDSSMNPRFAAALSVASIPDGLDIGQLLRVMWSRKLLILLCVVVGVAIGGYQAFLVAVPKYAATTTLVLRPQKQQVVDIQNVFSGISTDYYTINTELEVMESMGLLSKVVTSLDLTQDPEFNSSLRPEPAFSVGTIINKAKSAAKSLIGRPTRPDDPTSGPGDLTQEEADIIEAVNRLRRKIDASNMRDTYVFNIRVTTEGKMKSTRIANAIAQAYIQDQIDVKFQATENASLWLSERVAELEDELEEREQTLKDRRAALGLASPEALEAINQQAREVRGRLSETRQTVVDSQARISQLETLRDSGDLDRMVDEADSPTIRRLYNQFQQNNDPNARALILSQFEQLISQVQSNRDRAQVQADALEASLARIEQEIETESAKLIELQQLERETQATRTLYETFLTRLKETSVQRGLQQADSRVLSNAVPGVQVEPRRFRMVLVSAILGFVAGTVLILIGQFTRKGFLTTNELEAATGHTILGQIPKMAIRRRNQLLPYLRDKPTSEGAESIRNLRTSVLLSDIDTPPQVIMATSCLPGEGKTTTAIALAQNFAGLDKKVLIIEGDMRRRNFIDYFGFPQEQPGLMTALIGDATLEEIIYYDDQNGIYVLRSEKATKNAADIISSEKFHNLIAMLRQEFDYIIIDTPPVLIVPDARLYGQLADCLLMCVAWNRTPNATVIEGLRLLETVNLRPSGLILTQINHKGMSRYGYGYGSYGKYAKGYYDS
ncbi:capsular exopolysaccharide family [Mameliella alba]|nr:capsular exopolysaccharide synthesis family protein [Mameliella alba]SDD24818.1 capsular exopolysaccharide family [Mameliella alba]